MSPHLLLHAPSMYMVWRTASPFGPLPLTKKMQNDLTRVKMIHRASLYSPICLVTPGGLSVKSKMYRVGSNDGVNFEMIT